MYIQKRVFSSGCLEKILNMHFTIYYIVTSIILCSTFASYSAAFNLFEQIYLCKETIKDNTIGLHKKQTQGQKPSEVPPGSITYSDIEGLSEIVKQKWDTTRSDWVNISKDVFQYNDVSGDLTIDLFSWWESANDSFKLSHRELFEYHSPSKPSQSLYQLLINNVWINSSLTTYTYDSSDSLVSFSDITWDTAANDWEKTSLITGTVTYNTNGQVDTILVSGGGVTLTRIYSYLPDGRFYSEEKQETMFTPKMVFHAYPDDSTEILMTLLGLPVVFDTTDSIIITYNTSGKIKQKTMYSYRGCNTRSEEPLALYNVEYTNFDNTNQRPLMRMHLAYCENDKNIDPDSSRVLFYYNSSESVSRLFPNTRKNLTVGVRKYTIGWVIINGFELRHPEEIAFYTLDGRLRLKTTQIKILNGDLLVKIPKEFVVPGTVMIMVYKDCGTLNSSFTVLR